jgi:hypothetical protein
MNVRALVESLERKSSPSLGRKLPIVLRNFDDVLTASFYRGIVSSVHVDVHAPQGRAPGSLGNPEEP